MPTISNVKQQEVSHNLPGSSPEPPENDFTAAGVNDIEASEWQLHISGSEMRALFTIINAGNKSVSRFAQHCNCSTQHVRNQMSRDHVPIDMVRSLRLWFSIEAYVVALRQIRGISSTVPKV